MVKSHFTKEQSSIVAILAASVLWGTTGTAASFAPDVSPLAIGAFAMGFGGILQALLAYKQLTQELSRILQLRKKLFIGAVALTLYPLAFYSSMRLSGVAIGTVVSIASAPLFTVLIESLFGKQSKITRRWLISFCFGGIGIGLLVCSEPSAAIHSKPGLRAVGIALGATAGLMYAIYSWVAKAMIDNGVSSQAAMGGIFGIGAILLLPTLLVTGDKLFASSMNSLVAAYMALIPMCLGYILFGGGLRNTKASRASLLTLLEPVVAAVLSVLVLGEIIPWLGWLGIVLIFACLLLQSDLISLWSKRLTSRG
ncbi:DMT family transporter [Dongshaea marina]|uniref:DMT family transporter n=1 Tax=Dongshaea marina TaxID=2047966 RepID=UPI000D3EA196|nr:EamA family transporter [Dongshaea marina]